MPSPLRSLRQRARERIARWARQRQGADLAPFTLQARRIYILPTRAGLGFAVLIFAILVTALNYGNSMSLLIAFLLAGFALIAIHECHRQLKGLRVVHAHAEDSFAGRPGRVELRFENTLSTARGPIRLRCDAAAVEAIGVLPARSVNVQYLEYQAHERGLHRLDRIAVRTTAPHGLFRAWCWVHLPLSAYVYPLAAGQRPLPTRGGQRATHGQLALAAGAEEWATLRPFAVGDSPRAVAWKQYARGAPLMVAQYEGEAGEHHELDFNALPALGTEARLSQLCQWILRCEDLREAYSLQLPGISIARGQGAEQRRTALRALAGYGQITSESSP
jgi:uncharacterized protein (DUF58 family)